MPSVIRPAAVLLVIVLAGAAVSPAAQPDAIDISALSPWYGRGVSGIEVTGIDEALAKEARAGLVLTPRRKILRVRKTVLEERYVEADARRLRLFMARNGFPHATITATGTADDASDVKITFVINPGPAVVFGEVTVTGLPDAATAVADSARLAMPAGARFEEKQVFATQADIELAVRRAGYAEPRIEVAAARRDSSTADITYEVTPGALFTYERLVLEGVPDDLFRLTERTIGLEPGTPYSPRVVRDARRNLRDLDLFRQIRLVSVNRDSLDDPTDNGTLDLLADLRPRRMITMDAAVGTYTDNPVVVGASISHRNLFKKGRGVRVGGVYATHLRQLEIRPWWQALIMPRSRSDLILSYRVEDEDAYRLDRVSADFSTLFRPSADHSLRVGVGVSNGILDNRSADEESFASEVGLATVVHGKWYWDNSDSPLDPRTGHRLTVEGQWSPPGLWTDNPFASVRTYGSRYIYLGGDRVLAMRLDGGVAWPLGDAVDLVADHRFYAGGASTQRGYKRRRLGPVDSADQPIGGEVRVLAGMEARLPFWSVFGLAVFLDSGQVWRYTSEVDFSEYSVSGGLGIMLRTPIGPIRFDWAYNITDPQRNEPQSVFHFAIGHPY